MSIKINLYTMKLICAPPKLLLKVSVRTAYLGITQLHRDSTELFIDFTVTIVSLAGKERENGNKLRLSSSTSLCWDPLLDCGH